MASNSHHEKMHSITSTENSSSPGSSSSEESNSTPDTPPSPVAVLQPQSMIVEPQVVHSKSPLTPKRSPKRSTPPKNRLGAIEEDTDVVSPDIPVRSPRRLLGGMQHHKLFQLAFPPSQPRSRPPPPKIYDDIEGPKGEKFVDVRNNTRAGNEDRHRWKRFVCLGLVIVVIGAIVAIILIAVLLTRKRAHSAQQISNSNATNDASNQGFPTGEYAIASYLDEVDTSCTSNAATWNCYPYQTYNQSATASFTTLNWVISANSSSSNSANTSYLISSTDSLFSYTFKSRPLTLENKGTENEAYTFMYPYTKTIFPNVALTSDGSTTRCYYNNTLLTARLYTKKAKEASLMNTNSTTSGKNQPWPYALEFFDTIQAGPNVPNCYKYINGVDSEAVGVATASQADGVCRCAYQNYGV